MDFCVVFAIVLGLGLLFIWFGAHRYDHVGVTVAEATRLAIKHHFERSQRGE
jgi:hypothetical protein